MKDKLNMALSALGQALKKVFGRTAANGHASAYERGSLSRRLRASSRRLGSFTSARATSWCKARLRASASRWSLTDAE